MGLKSSRADKARNASKFVEVDRTAAASAAVESAVAESAVIVTGRTTLGELMQKHPAMPELMSKHGMHCIGCSIPTWETLENFARTSGLPEAKLSKLLNEANELIAKGESEGSDSGSYDFSMTQTAIAKLKSILKQENYSNGGLKVDVVAGGCGGFSYDFSVVEANEGNDLEFVKNGLKVFISKDSLRRINGAKIDYVESLSGGGLKVSNPNAKTVCGCGNSFG